MKYRLIPIALSEFKTPFQEKPQTPQWQVKNIIGCTLAYICDFRSDIFLGTIQSVKKKTKVQKTKTVTMGMWLRINSCFEKTCHFIESKDKGFDLKSQHTKKGFIAHSKNFTQNVNLARSPYLTSPWVK